MINYFTIYVSQFTIELFIIISLYIKSTYNVYLSSLKEAYIHDVLM